MAKYRARRRAGRYSFVPYLLSGLMKGQRKRVSAGGTINQRRRKYQSGGVTRQHDVRRVYSRRRAPASLRRKVRRYRKRFRSSLMKELATRTAFINEQVSRLNITDEQQWDSFILNGFRTSDSGEYAFGFRDWEYIAGRDNLLNETSGDSSGRLTGGGAKFYVDTSIMDVTIQNSSYDSSIGVDSRIPLEIDVYEFVCGNPKFKGLSSIIDQINSITASYVLRQGDPAQIGILSTDLRGVTPFEFGKALYELSIKVIKKTKYIVPGNDVITFQIRDTTNKVYNLSDVMGSGALYGKGAKGIFVISKPVTGSTLTPTSGSIQLNYGITRKYKYKVSVSHTDRGAFYRDVA